MLVAPVVRASDKKKNQDVKEVDTACAVVIANSHHTAGTVKTHVLRVKNTHHTQLKTTGFRIDFSHRTCCQPSTRQREEPERWVLADTHTRAARVRMDDTRLPAGTPPRAWGTSSHQQSPH